MSDRTRASCDLDVELDCGVAARKRAEKMLSHITVKR
jgi:hypothetical protein